MARNLACAVALAVGLAACARVEEPWTPKNGPLENDRPRPAEQRAELRDRVAHTQIDR